jgi:hypothetical protein
MHENSTKQSPVIGAGRASSGESSTFRAPSGQSEGPAAAKKEQRRHDGLLRTIAAWLGEQPALAAPQGSEGFAVAVHLACFIGDHYSFSVIR